MKYLKLTDVVLLLPRYSLFIIPVSRQGTALQGGSRSGNILTGVNCASLRRISKNTSINNTSKKHESDCQNNELTQPIFRPQIICQIYPPSAIYH